MAENPRLDIEFQDGNLQQQINLAEDVALKLGTATAGPYLVPVRASSLNSVLRFKHGPLVRSGAHHVDYSGPGYLMRMRSSVPGSIGAVTKTPGAGYAASLGDLTLSLAEYTVHTQVAGGAALNITTGWVAPPASFPLIITMGVGTVACTVTVTGVDTAGDTKSEAVTVTAAGVYTTTTEWASIIKVVSSIDPVGTSDFTMTWTSPGDRYNGLLTVVTGGVLGVTGGTTPTYKVSLDGGLTNSRTYTMPSSGEFDIVTYAGGLTPQATGVHAAFSAGSLTKTLYGGIKIAGATTDGDIVYNPKEYGDVTVTHVIPTINGQALDVSVAAHAITVTSATNTAGVKAYLTLGGNFNTVFEVDFEGTAGNSVTLATVGHAGAGAGSVAVVGNAVTIHYKDGVSTVTQMEALFAAPLAITLGHVRIKTAGTGANVLAAMGDTHAATPLAHGANAGVTSTAADVVAKIATVAAAAALVTPVAAGTTLGLLAAAGATGNTTGGVDLDAKKEGVSFRMIAAGASKTHSIAIVGRAVTLSVDTDAKGNQTTTATQAAAYIAANATAAALMTLNVDSGGGGIVGCLTTYTILPVSLATGDTLVFKTTPPAWSEADLQEACNALLANQKWLGYASIIHVIGDTTDTGDIVLATFIGDAANQKKQFKTVVAEATWMGDTNEVTWANNILAAYSTRSTSYGLAAGEANCYNSAYGTIDRMNVATTYVARLLICPISELPSHVDCETIFGTKNALDGVAVRPGEADQALWQSEDVLVTLNTANFITLRTHAGRSGIYVRQGLDFTDDGSDYTFVTNRRVANVAAALAYDEVLRFLNANLLADPKTGQLAEAECQKLESQVGNRLRKKLVANDRGRQHVSGLTFTIDRGADYISSGQVTGVTRIVPRTPATRFIVKIGFAPTLTSAIASGG